MCSKVMCKQCGKPTWSGCGEHIEIALAGIPESDRCPGQHSGSEGGAKNSGFLNRLLGR